MNKSLSKITLASLLLLPLLGRAQQNLISGHVVDAKTKELVPFASIGLLKAGTGALTNEHGYFQMAVPDEFSQDSLVVNTLGFSRRALLVEQGKVADLRIALSPLPAGMITICRVGPCRAATETPLPKNDVVIAGVPGNQYAFFINNDKRKEGGKLQSVSFYAGENGLPMAPFRVRIYQANGKQGMPAADLLTERVVLAPARSGEWFTSDLSSFGVVVPKEGCFVAMEFVDSAIPASQPVLDNYTAYGQIMRPTFDFKNIKLWGYSPEKGWALLPQSGSSRRYNAMVKLEVELNKQ